MKDVVCKFGGTSLANIENIVKVCNIIKENKRRFVVVSAPGKRWKTDTKITDILIQCYSLSKENKDYSQYFFELKNRFEEIKKGLNVKLNLIPSYNKLEQEIKKHSDYDYIISRGENFLARIISKYLNYTFLDAKHVIKFDSNNNVDLKLSKSIFTAKTKKTNNYIIPGFYGANKNGKIQTFSRGGSDITGAIISVLCNAKIYENYTDVNGFLTFDPTICDRPKVIKKLTYKELRGLSYAGANVLHPDCVRFLKENNVILNVKNTFNPACNGSIIMPDSNNENKSLTGVAGQKGYQIINIEKFNINEKLNCFESINKIFKSKDIPISQVFTSVDLLSIVVKSNLINMDILKEIIVEIRNIIMPDKVDIIANVAIISIVGYMLQRDSSLEGKVLESIISAKTKLLFLNKGTNSVSLMFGVTEQDYERVIKHLQIQLF